MLTLWQQIHEVERKGHGVDTLLREHFHAGAVALPDCENKNIQSNILWELILFYLGLLWMNLSIGVEAGSEAGTFSLFPIMDRCSKVRRDEMHSASALQICQTTNSAQIISSVH